MANYPPLVNVRRSFDVSIAAAHKGSVIKRMIRALATAGALATAAALLIGSVTMLWVMRFHPTDGQSGLAVALNAVTGALVGGVIGLCVGWRRVR